MGDIEKVNGYLNVLLYNGKFRERLLIAILHNSPNTIAHTRNIISRQLKSLNKEKGYLRAMLSEEDRADASTKLVEIYSLVGNSRRTIREMACVSYAQIIKDLLPKATIDFEMNLD